ncbi:MAG: signal peptidase I, signal peptidase I [Candidatus Wolfebacteria bacterium GW2011_GWC1_43_10]|uniref:Signal peptidase I n=2 Tax=Candidatus Wolfeibacteriota TaxID=1752735 RepID=A0A0G1CBL8_9BACT|nr:MAG: signal peptidase I, signal peptidase I [Candidatus Wolfebacteria bacterium GW2011_GWC1_43_10]KKT22285.1 MAG: Signal peptidase I [Parcubacteria group bacterium GW2011_GWB1_43_8b]OGM89083.1 MAG: signal peptidase I [Candidatus Wolfebacteria bacterium GWA1_42_9]
MRKFLFTVWEIAEVFLIALIAVGAIKYFLIQPFIVNGASMEPSFYDGDYLLIDEISYRINPPARGDVVVFKSPYNPSTYYIKRVIGLPGERVEVENSKIKIYNQENPNGFYVEESYLSDFRNDWSGETSFSLKDNQYFVMGDNRANSLDSRYWGPLEKDSIVGLVRLRLWPIPDMKVFEKTMYSQ